MDKTTVELANKLYFDLHMGIEASEAMIPKVQNNHLKEYLNTHVNKYKQIQDDVVKQFTRSGKKPKSSHLLSRSFLWMQAQLSAVRKSSDKEFIEAFIKGSSMGVESGQRLLNKYKKAELEIRDLVNELIDLESSNMTHLENLKTSFN